MEISGTGERASRLFALTVPLLKRHINLFLIKNSILHPNTNKANKHRSKAPCTKTLFQPEIYEIRDLMTA